MVKTRVHVPDACGHALSAGDFVFEVIFSRQFLTNWLIVGKTSLPERKSGFSAVSAPVGGAPRRCDTRHRHATTDE